MRATGSGDNDHCGHQAWRLAGTRPPALTGILQEDAHAEGARARPSTRVHRFLWSSASLLRGPVSGSGWRSPPLSPAGAGLGRRLSSASPARRPWCCPAPAGPSLSPLRGERGRSALSSRALCSTPSGCRSYAGSRLLGDFSAVGTGVRICWRARTERRNHTGRKEPGSGSRWRPKRILNSLPPANAPNLQLRGEQLSLKTKNKKQKNTQKHWLRDSYLSDKHSLHSQLIPLPSGLGEEREKKKRKQEKETRAHIHGSRMLELGRLHRKLPL
ncbi:uncharacterized protein LOC113934118 [Zalophus californianus]|uniref:Uncharacterized protein LOC113934118 n=1 Tax=Zalophus californianus TaxID=9704 RepID=A0A6J2EQE7_ZALCA|nr:uncharacterized protein LOC113934118 [Zalophus californianus]